MLRELEWCSIILYSILNNIMDFKHRNLVQNTCIMMEAGLELRLGKNGWNKIEAQGPYSTKYGNTNVINTCSELGLVH